MIPRFLRERCAGINRSSSYNYVTFSIRNIVYIVITVGKLLDLRLIFVSDNVSVHRTRIDIVGRFKS